jgi:hypothetical protein
MTYDRDLVSDKIMQAAADWISHDYPRVVRAVREAGARVETLKQQCQPSTVELMDKDT